MNRGTVYHLFMTEPTKGESSYLADHYKRGRAGIMRPPETKPLADAAWRAGRDSAVLTTQGRGE